MNENILSGYKNSGQICIPRSLIESKGGSSEGEIKRRIQMARGAMVKLKKLREKMDP